MAYGIVSDCNVQMGLQNHETIVIDQTIDNILTCAIKIVELCVGLHSLCSHVKPACQNTAATVHHKKVQSGGNWPSVTSKQAMNEDTDIDGQGDGVETIITICLIVL